MVFKNYIIIVSKFTHVIIVGIPHYPGGTNLAHFLRSLPHRSTLHSLQNQSNQSSFNVTDAVVMTNITPPVSPFNAKSSQQFFFQDFLLIDSLKRNYPIHSLPLLTFLRHHLGAREP